jgi:hypothetical protein
MKHARSSHAATAAACCIILCAGCTKRYIHYGELEALDSTGAQITTALTWVETVRTPGADTREGVYVVVKDRPQARVHFKPQNLVFECRSTDTGVTREVALYGEAGRLLGCESIDDMGDGIVRVLIHCRHAINPFAVVGLPQEYLAARAEPYEFEMRKVFDKDAPCWIGEQFQ